MRCRESTDVVEDQTRRTGRSQLKGGDIRRCDEKYAQEAKAHIGAG